MSYLNRLAKLLLFGVASVVHASSDGAGPVPDASTPFATVDGEVITLATYRTALRVAGRQTYYHARPPDVELEAFRRDVGEKLIVERLMLREARRRGLSPDMAWVEAEFSRLENRYSVSQEWQEDAATLGAALRVGLEERNLVSQIDEAFRAVETPSARQVEAYYEANPDKFTSPEQIRVSTILLKVAPWESSDVWKSRLSEAERIRASITGPGDFDRFATENPPDDQQQLGYIHRGMLAESAQAAVDRLQPGQMTDPVTLLEGIAIFRLDERIAPRLNPLGRVYARASELWSRERAEQVYTRRVAALRDAAEVELANPDYFRLAATVTPREIEPEREGRL